jgi:Lysozyme like domain
VTDLTFAQLESLWEDNGGSKRTAPTAAAIAEAESSGSETVTSSNPDGGTNVGLWQLDTLGVGSGFDVAQLQNPDLNAAVAVEGSGDGTNWGDWQTWTQGTYLQYLPGGAGAAAQSGPVPGSVGSGLSGSTSGSSGSSSNVEWWNPVSWLNIPGDAAQGVAAQIEDWALHYGAMGLGVTLGLVLLGVGIVRATRRDKQPAQPSGHPIIKTAAETGTAAALA